MIKQLLSIILVISISACSTFSVENVAKLQTDKKITVLSYVGNNMLVTNAAGQSSETWHRFIDTKDWQENEYIENKILAATAKDSRFKFIRGNMDKYRNQIKQITGSGLNEEIEIIGTPSVLHKLVKDTDADLILITISTADKSIDKESNGLELRQGPTSQNIVSLKFILYDPHNKKSIAQLLTHSSQKHLSFSKFKEKGFVSKFILSSFKEIYFPMVDTQIKEALEKMTIIKPAEK